MYFVKHLRTAASVYFQDNINLEKSLLKRDLLLIHSIQLRHNYQTILVQV